tara:strand:- start:394 stop:597 length:204 start_codon:yes stop_codon:yes gene_type:complete
MIKEKGCDICEKSGKIHFRVKSINFTKWIFYCRNAGVLSQKKINISMEELEKILKNNEEDSFTNIFK